MSDDELLSRLAPDTLLRRKLAAEALTAAGFPIKASTLSTIATRSRGGRPRYQLFGRVPLCRWGDLVAWAQGRMSEPRGSTFGTDARPDSAA